MSGTEFKVGDLVKITKKDCTLGWYNGIQNLLGTEQVIDECYFDNTEGMSYKVRGWYFPPASLELVQQPKQFSPEAAPTGLRPCKPGDKIICNNGEEFTCCTREFLQDKNIVCYEGYKIHAYRYSSNCEYTGVTWMGWSLDGKASGCKEWNIREVIPKQKDKSGTNSFDKNDATQGGYMEIPRNQDGTLSALNVYTAEDIRNAWDDWDDLGWWEDHLKIFKKSLDKVTSPEYKEYLRLKAMFEPESE